MFADAAPVPSVVIKSRARGRSTMSPKLADDPHNGPFTWRESARRREAVPLLGSGEQRRVRPRAQEAEARMPPSRNATSEASTTTRVSWCGIVQIPCVRPFPQRSKAVPLSGSSPRRHFASAGLHSFASVVGLTVERRCPLLMQGERIGPAARTTGDRRSGN